jgi:glucose/arabinose dehydrogenase
VEFQLPEYEFPAHVAARGMRFYTADQFPEEYRGGIFVADDAADAVYRISYRP